MNRPIPIPAHHPSPLMPERGGHVTLPHVAAASSALSRHGLPGAATFSPASVGEPLHPHPGGVAAIRGSGPASPMRPNGVGFNREASGLAAEGKRIRDALCDGRPVNGPGVELSTASGQLGGVA